MKKVLPILFILFLLALFNSFQVYNYYIVRINGDINFYDIPTHISTFLYSLGSFGITLMVWRYLGRLVASKLKFIYVFLSAIPLFGLYASIVYLMIRNYYGAPTSLEMLWGNFIFTLSLSHFYISGLTIAYLFFIETNELKERLMESKYEIENMQLQMLKKNIEPHFLFNNLSILSSLARKDVSHIDEFIENLADVYRYFLVHNAVDSVSLKEDLKFLKKYIALTTERFGNSYSIVLKIDDQEGDIIPFALQICLENAIKHNEGNEADPLVIEFIRNGDMITVRNQIRPVEMYSNTGLGLSNIAKRYDLIYGETLTYGPFNNYFIVELPVITNK
ncbi:sensor histidine kinase [Chryseobacterium gallinarum]|uniref:Histidine kinase n=1 Tax=Chryseobacterium gallinarum TaxID=1324352 RepID=A0ABX6KML9_CHRGL|nr:histidine kinase [Chryseobacterium gallinarum]MCL8538135.1 histidine kinase [Chryseobacterium gallinarum]QIY89886.1 histidine kinase [Chryseobacterium gallinarum]